MRDYTWIDSCLDAKKDEESIAHALVDSGTMSDLGAAKGLVAERGALRLARRRAQGADRRTSFIFGSLRFLVKLLVK
jgi:hypothetical protein